MDIYYIVLLVLVSALLFRILMWLKFISEILVAMRNAQFNNDKTFAVLADLQRRYMELRVSQENAKGGRR